MKETIESRLGGRDYLQSGTRFFMHLLSKGRVNQTVTGLCLIGYTKWVEDHLKDFVESSQIDLAKFNPKDILKAVQYPKNDTLYLTERSFDWFRSIGIPISDQLLNPNAIRVENLKRMIKDIMEETSSIIKSMQQMHYLLHKQKDTTLDTMIQQVVQTGVLNKLVEFLLRDDSKLQHSTLDVLADIASGTSEHVEEVVKLGAIPSLVHLLGSSHTEVPPPSARALGNIIECDQNHRDLLLQSGVIPPLVKLLEDQISDIESVRTYARLSALLCLGKNPRPCLKTVFPLIQVLKELLCSTNDVNVIEHSCRALYHLSNGPDEDIQAVIDALDDTGIRHLVELLEHSNIKVQRPVLKTVGNIATGNDSQTQLIIDNNVLPHLLELLSSPKNGIVKEACWIISNITAGSKAQIQAVLDSGIFPELFPLLNSEEDGIQCEVSFAIINATQGCDTEQVKDMVNQDCIPHLLDLLEGIEECEFEVDVLSNVLGALEHVSQICNITSCHLRL